MNFEYPAAAEQFRSQLRQFLAEELPDWWISLWHEDERVYPFTRKFCQKLAKRGWLTMAWPSEYGGADADVWTQMVVREEMIAVGEPRGPQYMNLNYIGPTIMQFGTPEQKERFLKPMTAGDVLWCQGFSEPDAGSDLAALSTQATDTGKCFVINGQKIWTSYATAADWCLLLARTDPDSKRHKGLSMFLVDMKTPGITVRPIPSMRGPHEICELFFDDVEVPYDCLLGPRDAGWSVAIFALPYERVGVAWQARIKAVFDKLLEYVQTTTDENGRPLSERPSVRAGLVRIHARYRAARLMHYRINLAQAEGNANDMDPATFKVFSSEADLLASDIGLDIIGSKGQLTPEDPLAPIHGYVITHWIECIPELIAGGTNEIQRNIISQRGLGLPR